MVFPVYGQSLGKVGALWNNLVRYPDPPKNCTESCVSPTGQTEIPSHTRTCLAETMSISLLEPGNCFQHFCFLGFFKVQAFVEEYVGLSESYRVRCSFFFSRQVALVQAICVPLGESDHVFQP